jgi:Tat protein translocase TatB subunit
MFDLGMQELIVIFIVALLVFGPKKLPELGRTLGKAIAELKRSMHSVKEQMDSELQEFRDPLSLEKENQTIEEDKPVEHPEDISRKEAKNFESHNSQDKVG